MSVLLAILVALSTYRLTRLVTTDAITLPLRARLEMRPLVGYLVSCSWCLSIWVAPWPALVAVRWPDHHAVWVVLLALSASAATGLLSRFD